ncbi:conserved hypothetical protein [Agrobacterium sp. NCPPB 925]|nr:conserved hypothetical protein [Agrobacterium sp. NCPPB 925]
MNIVSQGRFHHGARGRKKIVPDRQDSCDVDRGCGNRADRVEHAEKNRRNKEKKAQKPQKSFHPAHLGYGPSFRQPRFKTYIASIKPGKPVCNRIERQEIADISKNCQIRVDPCEFIGIYRAVPVICISSKHADLKKGQVAEWFKAHAWNACVRESVPWVRIPPCPPFHLIFSRHCCSKPLPDSPYGRLPGIPSKSRFSAFASVNGYASAQTGVSYAFLLRFPLSCALQQEKSLLIYAAELQRMLQIQVKELPQECLTGFRQLASRREEHGKSNRYRPWHDQFLRRSDGRQGHESY